MRYNKNDNASIVFNLLDSVPNLHNFLIIGLICLVFLLFYLSSIIIISYYSSYIIGTYMPLTPHR